MSVLPEFWTLHRDLPREGPGCAADVHWALALIPPPARVAEVACGPGADLVALAEALPAARIEGSDITPHFVAAAQDATARFGARVTVRQGDLREVAGPVDLIWCAGAAYVVGLEAALAAWRPALAPGGAVAVSEPVLPEGTGTVAASFWDGFPVGDAASVTARICAAGFRPLHSRLVIGAAWEAYYAPMEVRIARLRPGASAELTAVLDDGAREARLWRQAPDEIAYLLTLAAPA